MTQRTSYSSWITSKHATSWPVAALLVINYVGTGFLVPAEDYATNGVSSHLLDFMWSSGMASSLLVFAFIFKSKTQRTLVQNSAAWITSSVVAALFAIVTVYVVSGRLPNRDYVVSLIWATSSLIGAAVSFTLVVAGFREGTALTKSLKKKQRALLSTRATAVSVLSNFAIQLREPLSSMLERLSLVLRPTLQLGAQTKPAVTVLGSFIENDLRRTITQLQKAAAEPAEVEISKRAILNESLLQVRTKDSISLSGLYATAVLFFAPAAFAYSGLPGLFGFGLAIASTLAFQLLWYKLAGNRLVIWPVLAVAQGTIFGVFVYLFMSAFGGLTFPTLSTSVICFVLAATASAIQSVIVRRTKLNQAFEKLNSDLKETITEIQRRGLALQTRATRSLHNDVQATLLRISLMLSSRQKLDEQLLEDVEQQLTKIEIGARQQSSSIPNFNRGLKEIVEFWEGVLKIDLVVDSEATKSINSDPDLVERVLAVLREALTNAAKYSVSKDVQVRITSIEDFTVSLFASNQANPLLRKERLGEGTGIMDENATSWTRSVSGEKFTLEATFSLLPGALG